jgi:hypothetical protein
VSHQSDMRASGGKTGMALSAVILTAAAVTVATYAHEEAFPPFGTDAVLIRVHEKSTSTRRIPPFPNRANCRVPSRPANGTAVATVGPKGRADSSRTFVAIILDRRGASISEAGAPKEWSESEQSGFLERLRSMAAFGAQSQDRLKLIEDRTFSERMESSVRLVLRSDPPCAWRWDEVRALVREYGARLVLRGYGRINPFGDDPTGRSSAVVSAGLRDKRVLERTDASEAAALMVRSATRITAERLVLESSGYRALEMDFARMACGDFDLLWSFIEEAMVSWNMLRFAGSLGCASPLVMEDVALLSAFDRGRSKPFFDRILKAIGYAYGTDGADGLGERAASFGSCSFPPIARGPKRGHALNPLDFDDSLIKVFEEEMLKAARDEGRNLVSL